MLLSQFRCHRERFRGGRPRRKKPAFSAAKPSRATCMGDLLRLTPKLSENSLAAPPPPRSSFSAVKGKPCFSSPSQAACAKPKSSDLPPATAWSSTVQPLLRHTASSPISSPPRLSPLLLLLLPSRLSLTGFRRISVDGIRRDVHLFHSCVLPAG